MLRASKVARMSAMIDTERYWRCCKRVRVQPHVFNASRPQSPLKEIGGGVEGI